MYLKIAVRNIKVHWKQSLAALFSISVAFFCFVLFQGYMLDVRYLYLDGYRNRSMLGDFMIQNRQAQSPEYQKDPWKYALSKNDQDRIRQIFAERSDDIFSEVRSIEFQGLVSTGISSKTFLGRAYDVATGAVMRENWTWDTLYGVPLHESQSESPLLLGQTLAQQLGCNPDKKIYSLRPQGGYVAENRPFTCRTSDMQLSVTTPTGNLNAMDFELVGLVDGGYKDIDSRFLVIDLENAQRLLNTESVTYWSVKLKPHIDARSWRTKFNKTLQQTHPHLEAIDWQDHPAGDLYLRTMELLNIFRNFVTIVVAFISILSVMNTMVKIVSERTREIGTLLSLGFRRSYVLKIFMTESLFLSIIGVLIGAAFAFIFTFIINSIQLSYKAGLLSEPVLFKIDANLGLYGYAFLLLIVVTLLASYLSCRTTINKKIVDCLGHV